MGLTSKPQVDLSDTPIIITTPMNEVDTMSILIHYKLDRPIYQSNTLWEQEISLTNNS